MADMFFPILVDSMHGKTPMWELRVHFVVGDDDSESFIMELLDVHKNALFINWIVLETGNLVRRNAMSFELRALRVMAFSSLSLSQGSGQTCFYKNSSKEIPFCSIRITLLFL